MPVTLNSVTFDGEMTAVKEKLEEVGGRDERRITLSGLVTGLSTVEAIDSRLDEIAGAASVADYSAALSLRAGRRLWVRRENFRREVRAEEHVGSFTLELAAHLAFEESIALSTVDWTIESSGATLNVVSTGNLYAQPVIALTPLNPIIDPAIGDGERTIAFYGTVGIGETLILDAASGIVALNGHDVTPYTTGNFPRITSAGTTLTYTDDIASSHSAVAIVAYRDRWW